MARINTSLRALVGASVLVTAPAWAQSSPGDGGEPGVESFAKYVKRRPTLVADVAERVSPAVVNIRVSTATGEVVSQGHGSGFVISTAGEVVTNHHVIDDGEQIQVEFNNGAAFEATVIGTDPETDVALLQINSDQDFPKVEWHDETPLRVGEFVIPIGNPFGIGQSVSFGVISAIGRDRVDSGAFVDYIQTDATVNTGNSGGPLFDVEGRVVGINSAIYSPTGASVGIAFAIPHGTARRIIARLRKYGEVRRGYLGVGVRTGSYDDGTGGAIVDSVVPGSPAAVAGLQRDDIILKVNGTAVSDGTTATRAIGRVAPGNTVTFEIERGDTISQVTATLTLRPTKAELERRAAGLPPREDYERGPSASRNSAPSRRAPPKRHIGMGDSGLSLVDLSAQFRDAIGMDYDEVGVYIETVLPDTRTATRGFDIGMVLMDLDGQPIPSVDKFRELVAAAQVAGRDEVRVRTRLKNGTITHMSLPVRQS